MSLKPFVAVPTTDREWQKWMRETYDLRVMWGDGDPEGVVLANRGRIFMRENGGAGTTMYIKESGDGLVTGWRAV